MASSGTMVQKKFTIPAVGIGVLAAGGFLGQRLISKWRINPDPLDGKPAEFPSGIVRPVTLPDGAVINTVTVGEGPTIVCVHGLTTNRNDWGPMAPALLDAGFTLLAVEQRGHGESTEGTAGYGSKQLGDDLAVVLETLDVEAIAVMGHSMGGMAAMAYAVDHPDAFHRRVASLILLATAASMRTGRHAIALRLGGLVIPEALQPPESRLRVATGLMAFGARPSLHMIDQIIGHFRTCPDDVRAKATAALADHHVEDQLASVHVPALVVGASRDQMIRPFQVEQLAEALANSRLEMLPSAGHMVIWERHEQLTTMIIDWLDQDVATGRASSEHQPDHEPT